MVPENKCTADIGTDHGFVPLSLVAEGTAARAIASDVRKGPLERAEAHIREAGFEERIECRLGDGLSVLAPGEAEVIVIAGMGGMLMARILKEAPETARSARHLFLSPHRDAYELRKYLWEQGFQIEEETMVREDGKYYPVIRTGKKASSGASEDVIKEAPIRDLELRFGPVLLKKRPEVFLRYLRELEQRTEEAIRRLQEGELSDSVRSALREKNEELGAIRKALHWEDEVKGLRIRKMTEEDLEDLHALLSDQEVMKYLEAPYTREKTEAFLKKAGLQDLPLVYAAEEDSRFIGYVIFHGYDEESMEIGWVLRKDYWGRGIASSLTEMLLEKAFVMGKDAVIECHPGQQATKHLALKLGFSPDGLRDSLEVYRLRRPQT